MTDLIGRTLGQYQIIEQIGRGGMATVFKAYQPSLDRYVALKILPPLQAQQPDFTKRFQREAKTIANLNHPHILPVYDFGQDGDFSFLTMRYVEQARTLKQVIATNLTLSQVADLVGQIAAALDAAHQKGIVHRDVKPSNILMDGDWTLLADFGLARMMEDSVKLTGTGVGIGTPAYMSPEQGQGLAADHRTDIYALGIILFEMLTRQIPHNADTPFGIILKRATEPLPLPCAINPQIPEPIERVILKALAKKPDNRFASAGTMAETLTVALSETGAQTLPLAEEEQSTVLSPAMVTPETVLSTASVEQDTEDKPTPGQKIVNLLIGGQDKSRDQRNRQTMLNQVYDFWVKGVLENSLHNVALIDLGLEARPEAVDHPWQMVLQSSELPQLSIPTGTKVIDVFNELGRSLLILGEPGSGKTTMLLELARDLINGARQDPTQPIPVIFNLSSWSESQHPLEKWLVKELNSKYSIPKKVAQQWLDDEALIPLLDGLDEVAQSHREACVEAINLFYKENMQPLIVCSRIADYEVLATKLGLQQAVCLQPLSQDQIEAYLAQFGPDLSSLKQALQTDSDLQELAQSPLMLSIMTLAYRGDVDTEFALTDSIKSQSLASVEARRNHLFDTYIQRMFERRAIPQNYTPQQTVIWLGWLAQRMNNRKQSVFHIEGLQPNWLETNKQQKVYKLILKLIYGLMFGLVSGLVGIFILWILGVFYIFPLVGLLGGLIFGLFGGLFFGLLTDAKRDIEPFDGLQWSAQKGLKGGLRAGLLVLLLVGLSFGVIFELFVGLLETVMLALFGGLLIGLFVDLLGGLQRVRLELRAKPNQGINQSLRNGLLYGLLVGLFFGLIGGAIGGTTGGVINELLGGLSIGLFMGLSVGLGLGGEAVIRHYTLRLILAGTGQLPYKLIPFLDDCANRIFLRKVGGGYIFIHRLLLEHFAGLNEGANTKSITILLPPSD